MIFSASISFHSLYSFRAIVSIFSHDLSFYRWVWSLDQHNESKLIKMKKRIKALNGRRRRCCLRYYMRHKHKWHLLFIMLLLIFFYFSSERNSNKTITFKLRMYKNFISWLRYSTERQRKTVIRYINAELEGANVLSKSNQPLVDLTYNRYVTHHWGMEKWWWTA